MKYVITALGHCRRARSRAARRGRERRLRPDLPQGARERRRRLDRAAADAADRPQGRPLRRPERAEGGQRSRVVVLRPLPVAVQLASKYGATSSVRNAVAGAFKPYGNKATADVTHLRMTATISISTAQKMFGTKWALYRTSTAGQLVALPVDTPKLPHGLAGNVDIVAGLRLNVVRQVGVEPRTPAGTPTRTGTVAPNCLDTADPGRVGVRLPACSPTRSSRRTGSRRCTRAGCRARACGWRSSARRRRRPPTSTTFRSASVCRAPR